LPLKASLDICRTGACSRAQRPRQAGFRQVSGLARDRTGGTLKYKRSRAEQKKLLLEQGCEFFEGTPKHRYVGIYGDKRTKRLLKTALRWPVLPYPKRPTSGEPIQTESS
jgi:hypothetical protein